MPTQDASAIEESNALALAIVLSGQNSCIPISLKFFCCHLFTWGHYLILAAGTAPVDYDASQANRFDPTGWELALVTTPSTDLSSVQERQLVCSCAANFSSALCFATCELDIYYLCNGP